jgi:hypothetical protein
MARPLGRERRIDRSPKPCPIAGALWRTAAQPDRARGPWPIPRWGDHLRLIATLHDPAVIGKILANLRGANVPSPVRPPC